MNKTPVSILQEMMVKQGMIPDYELIHDGGGRHVNTFTYRVTCDGLSANGTGRCKKDAKHEAAKAMLSEIAAHRNYPQLPAASTPTVSPTRSPFHSAAPPPRISTNMPFINAIGELQDLCAENNLKEPEYLLIRDTGPPHARVFTIRCIVSNFIEDGIATTKKQAKHDAAKKMVERIKGLVNESEIEEELSNSSIMTNMEIMNENAKEYYHLLSKTTRKVNLGIRLSEYHINWRNSIEMDKRDKILEELNSILPDKLSNLDKYVPNDVITEKLHKFESILSEVNINVCLKDLVADNDYFMNVLELNTCPLLTQIGMGENKSDATWKALIQMINSLKLLLS